MALTLGINGFGRIGRLVLRSILERESNGEDFHLFQYDTAQGTYDGDVSYSGEDTITIDGEDFRVFSEKDPANLPWGDLGADVVVESTGLFRTREKASAHLDAGADKVIISAPAKSDDVPTFVLGVNDDDLSGDEDIVSNASCTTNSLAPLVKTLNDAFGIESGVMTTVHAYTASQNILDGPGTKDLRRARAAAESIIPTSTGAAQAIGLVVPELDGKLDGMAMRVPIPAGSITDLVVDLGTEASADEVNAAFRENADGPMSGVLEYNETPIVSTDVVHNPHSCIFDAPSTMTQGRQVKVLGWYDNEWGFANRMVDLARKLAS
ncbi:MAG: type I glyceraldehyde-3-phosphate dehydrogenase [Bacteroidetes bacterium SW_4_67_19]|nr:MAG: type I glyceraldehyde-3-phosphate dehydrogenase [Bacteroidetes bacterium SW_4_67_19]